MTEPEIDSSDFNEEIDLILEPYVKSWFIQTFPRGLNIVQQKAIPQIHKQENTLISSPTGSGKTLAAFMSIINALSKAGHQGELEDTVYCLYISPLRALSNDINKNLVQPLEGIQKHAQDMGIEMPNITKGLRTGDTSPQERQYMTRRPPHIFITTPESLAIVLCAPKFRESFRTVKWVIIDEIHALADNKRGALLSLSLERLDAFASKKITRIGLSATQAPLVEIGHFLTGWGENIQQCKIIQESSIRALDLQVISTVDDLIHETFGMIEQATNEYLLDLMSNYRSMLVFTNTRKRAERITYQMKDLVGPDEKETIGVHHGSLSREARLQTEQKLKEGDLKTVFSSTSLELGIDIGTIDIVGQIDSPKSVSSALQRVGRSGHSMDREAIGRIIIFNREELGECAIIAKNSAEGIIDRIDIIREPLDVLSQSIVGMAVEKRWDINEAYEVVKQAYPYKDLEYDTFVSLISKLASGGTSDESWKRSRIWYDQEKNLFGRRKISRLTYLMNVGTIPDTTSCEVILEQFRTKLGTLSEKFAEKINQGDIFVLGGRSYEFVRTSGDKLIVRDAPGRLPTIPSWAGEMLPRSFDVSIELGKLYGFIEGLLLEEKHKELETILTDQYYLDKHSSKALVSYCDEQLTITGALPSDKFIPIERYVDLVGRTNIIFHSIFGRRVNYALSQAYAGSIAKEHEINIGVSITDNAFVLVFPFGYSLSPEDILALLSSTSIRPTLKKIIRDSELFTHRFRHCAVRALYILKNHLKRRKSVDEQKRSAKSLLEFQEEYVSEIVEEAFREIFEEVMDIDNCILILQRIEMGELKVKSLPISGVPSPFAHEVLLSTLDDVVTVEDRGNLLRELHKQVLERVMDLGDEEGDLLPEESLTEYFNQKQNQLMHSIAESTNKGEQLTKALTTWGVFTPKKDLSSPSLSNEVKNEILELGEKEIEEGRILQFFTPEERWVTPGKLEVAYNIYGEESLSNSQQDLLIEKYNTEYSIAKTIEPVEALKKAITSYLSINGPTCASRLTQDIGVSETQTSEAIKQLLAERRLLAGKFIELEETPQFICSKDREVLQSQRAEKERISKEALIRCKLKQQFLLEDEMLRGKGSIQELLRRLGPLRSIHDFSSRIADFSVYQLQQLIRDGEIIHGRILSGRLAFALPEQVQLLSTIFEPEREILPFETKILDIIKETGPINRKELIDFSKMDSLEVSSGIQYLESNMLIFRHTIGKIQTPSPELNVPIFFIGADQATSDSHERKDVAKQLVVNVVQGYGPIDIYEILRRVPLEYAEVEVILTELLEQSRIITRQITRVGKPHYLTSEQLSELLQFTSIEESGRIQPLKDEIIILGTQDTYLLTEGEIRLSRYGGSSNEIVLVNNQIMGTIEFDKRSPDLYQLTDLKIRSQFRYDYSLLHQLANKIIKNASRHHLATVVQIEEINTKGILDRANRTILLAFTRANYSQSKGTLIGGGLSSQTFSSKKIIQYWFEKQKPTLVIARDLGEELLEFINQQQIIKLSHLFDRVPGITYRDVLNQLNELLFNKKIAVIRNNWVLSQEIWELLKTQAFLSTEDLRLIKRISPSLSGEEELNEKIITRKTGLDKANEIIDILERGGIIQRKSLELQNRVNKWNVLEEIEVKVSPISHEIKKELVQRLLNANSPTSLENIVRLVSIIWNQVNQTVLFRILFSLEEEGLLKHRLIETDHTLYYYWKEDLDKIASLTSLKDQSSYLSTWWGDDPLLSVFLSNIELVDSFSSNKRVVILTPQSIAFYSYKKRNGSMVIDNISFPMELPSPVEITRFLSELEREAFRNHVTSLKIDFLDNQTIPYWLSEEIIGEEEHDGGEEE
ncbi:MAG: ATP-dependent helicase [Candidatus Heimdallarchaeota archaeon]|nr:ATP-dependent helicase [Candidatus Heimdallarchaeota archaeon]MCK5047975.1 ATP-dependent helicase [Candidatus Heimdallarchaeota archaeon]